jgi:hypothetical protein
MPEGGWFSITFDGADRSLDLQAPEVTPALVLGPFPPPTVTGRERHERAALRAYVEATRRLR